MVRNLAGQRILITGASGGIGRCLAEQLALAGARVALSARSADVLNELAASLRGRGAEVVTISADLESEADRQRLVATAAEAFGGLDVLINNAGLGSWGHFADSSEDILRRIMEVNFFAPAELMRLALPILEQGKQPAVVNVASMCGRKGMPAWTEYSASKFALCGLTEALRGEFSRFDVDVLLIVPGLTRGGLGRHLIRRDGRFRIDFDRGMPPESVAAQIVRSLRRNKTETVIGWDARWMLRAHRFFPRLVDWLIARRVKKLYEPQASAAPGLSSGR